MYRRPSKCLMCEFPIVGGGVQLSEVNLDKLSVWLIKNTGHNFRLSAANGNDWLCQFCLWDVRYLFEHCNEIDKDFSIVWWPNQHDQIYENFYKRDLLKPCFVRLLDPIQINTSEVVNEEELNQSNSPIIMCPSGESAELVQILSNGGNRDFKSDESSHCDVRNRPAKSVMRRKPCRRKSGPKKLEAQHVKMAICIYCNAVVEDKMLYKHVKKEHSKIAIKCNYVPCKVYFKTVKDKEIHIENVHIIGRKVSFCIYCNKWISHRSFGNHITTMHSSVAIRCKHKLCPTYFKTLKEKDEHENVNHKFIRKSYTCVICEKAYTSLSNLNNHMKEEHKDNYHRCSRGRCRKYFKNMQDLDLHFLSAHAKEDENCKLLVCDFCGHKTNSKGNLLNHICCMHFPKTKEHKCTQCSKCFSTEYYLKCHLKFHNEKKSCKYCNRKFSPRVLANHVGSNVCKKCGTQLDCAGQRNEHTRKCTFRYDCEFCPEQFQQKHELRNHKIHKHLVKPKPDPRWRGLKYKANGHKCEKCAQYFDTKPRLEFHKRSNAHLEKFRTGVSHRTYTCELCKRTLTGLHSMKVHLMAMHGFNAQNFDCTQCKRSFIFKYLLENHIKRFHCKKVYVQCEICKRTFLKDVFRFHIHAHLVDQADQVKP